MSTDSVNPGNLPAVQDAGTIPQSQALAEASPDSISELCSRDPNELSKVDIVRLIEALRAQRVKWAAGEAEKASNPKPKKAVAGAARSLISTAKVGDLDL